MRSSCWLRSAGMPMHGGVGELNVDTVVAEMNSLRQIVGSGGSLMASPVLAPSSRAVTSRNMPRFLHDLNDPGGCALSQV